MVMGDGDGFCPGWGGWKVVFCCVFFHKMVGEDV